MQYYNKKDAAENTARNYDGVELEDLLYEYFEYKKDRNREKKAGHKPCEPEAYKREAYKPDEPAEFYDELSYYDMPYEAPCCTQSTAPSKTDIGKSSETALKMHDETLYDAPYESPFDSEEDDWKRDRSNRVSVAHAPGGAEKPVKKPESEYCSDVIKMLAPMCAKALSGHKGNMDKRTVSRLVDKVINDACQYDDIEDITLETDREYLSRYKLLWALIECMILHELKR